MDKILRNDLLIGAGVGLLAGAATDNAWFGLGAGLLSGGVADIAQREWSQEPYYQNNVYNNGNWSYGGFCSTPDINARLSREMMGGMFDWGYNQGFDDGFFQGRYSDMGMYQDYGMSSRYPMQQRYPVQQRYPMQQRGWGPYEQHMAQRYDFARDRNNYGFYQPQFDDGRYQEGWYGVRDGINWDQVWENYKDC